MAESGPVVATQALPRATEAGRALRDLGPEGRGSCPLVLDIARFESGDLTPIQQIAFEAHAVDCPRCSSALEEIRCARNEILGETPGMRSDRSRRAAEAIEAILRRRTQ